MKTIFILSILLSWGFNLSAKSMKRSEVAQYLQDISVTIRSSSDYSTSEGSGVLINRAIEKQKVSFVLTCAHVIQNLRKVKTTIQSGATLKFVEFKDVNIIKELVEGGRRVGEMKMDASVIKYSDARNGHDLALLMVRARDYGKASAQFYINKDEFIIPIGTPLFHVGSLLGQMGANSMTTGIISQVGRVESKFEFDQTTVTAFPGSSGGGVFLEDGKYVGMIARGAGEGFNLMVPIRRILAWAEEHQVMWLFDPSLETPTFDEINALPLENSISENEEDESEKSLNLFTSDFPYLIRTKYK